MKSKYDYSEIGVRKIEFLIPRLKYSVYPTKLIQWLENFEEKDIESAIDLLRVFEYIPFPEFMSRLDSLLKEVLKLIPINEKIIIFPYGKVGKSGTLVTYPLRNTSTYKKRKNDIFLTHDYQNIENPSNFKHIIFLDDFVGTGKTFCDEFENSGISNWLDKNRIKNIFLLSTIIMTEGKNKINALFPDIKIISDVRNKLFDEVGSPFNAFDRDTYKRIKRFAEKYGNRLIVGRPPNQFQALGYGESQSAVAFFHGTPNNSLSIIWGSNKDWCALFPRSADVRMTEARKLKKDIAYYLSICEKLGINLYIGSDLIEKRTDKRTANTRLLRAQSHAAVTLLFLLNKGYENLFICQILGITREELKYIYYELVNKDLVNKRYEITIQGQILLKKLSAVTNRERIRNETENNLTIKKYLYLPKLFKGLT